MDAFESARRVAVRMMRTAALAEELRNEDPTMVRHIPQLTRINRLGMITSNSQAGRNSRYTSRRTGKRELMAERAYCVGFVHPDVADAFIEWMWLHTDKYVARMRLADGVHDETGRIGVTVAGTGTMWETKVSPFYEANDRTCNYGRALFPEQGRALEGKMTDAMLATARKQIGPYLAHPVPDTAVGIVLVDMKWGRRADTPKGLFSEIERGLRRARKAPK